MTRLGYNARGVIIFLRSRQMDTALLDALPRTIDLQLTVSEPDIIAELSKYREGADQNNFALSALRIGILALRQANGLVDVSAVRSEGERLVSAIRDMMTANTS